MTDLLSQVKFGNRMIPVIDTVPKIDGALGQIIYVKRDGKHYYWDGKLWTILGGGGPPPK